MTRAEKRQARSSLDRLQSDISAVYATVGEKPFRPWRSRLSARQYGYLFSCLIPLLDPQTRVLDWGCGNGEISWWLTREGMEVSALDLAPPHLQREIERLPSARWSFHEASNPTRLPFVDRAFDLILSIGVLEHVRDTGGDEVASLTEIYRLLRPGGTFICYHLPNHGSWIEFLARRTPNRHSHNQLYCKAAIQRLFTESGLEVQRIRRYGLLPRNEAARLPGSGTAVLSNTFDFVDRALESVLSPLAQNFMVVASRAPS